MNVDPLARWYRGIEYLAFGRSLESARFCFLDRLKTAQRVLVLGEGDGRALAGLLRIAPQACVHVVEISARMIELAKQRIPSRSHVTFHQEDASLCDFAGESFDAILTCFFLDCFTEDEAERLIRHVSKFLKPAGFWLVAEFSIPSKGWRRWHAKLWIFVMYRFFAFTTGLRTVALAPFDAIFSSNGFDLLEIEQTRAGLISASLWRKRS